MLPNWIGIPGWFGAGADLEARAGRAQHDTARRIHVEEVGGQAVRRRRSIRDAIPVDFTPARFPAEPATFGVEGAELVRNAST